MKPTNLKDPESPANLAKEYIRNKCYSMETKSVVPIGPKFVITKPRITRKRQNQTNIMKAYHYTTSDKKYALILEKLDKIEAQLKESNIQIMNAEEAAKYLSFSKAYLYKLTHNNSIPFYKPGKKVYFNKVDLDNWILSHRRKSNEEIQREADEYIRTHSWK